MKGGITSTSTSRKRKRRLTKGEKIREGIRNRCKELDTNMARWMVDLVMDQVAVEHNCQESAAYPAWMCREEKYCRRLEEELEMRISIQKLSMEIEVDGMPGECELEAMFVIENESLEVPVCTSRMKTSPVRIIIEKFEDKSRIDGPFNEKTDVKKYANLQ